MATATKTVKAPATGTATKPLVTISEAQKKAGAALIQDAKVIVKSAKDLGKEIHSLLMRMAKHAAQYRDVSAMTYFVTELDSKSDGRNESVLRVSAIKQWLVTFGYARWVSDKKKNTEGFKLASDRLDATDEKARNENFAKGAATPFNKFTPEQPFSPIDSFAAIESLIKRLSSKIDDHGINSKGVDVKNKIDPNHIKALEALRDSLKTPIEPTLIIKAQSPEGKKLAAKRTPKQQTAVNQAEGNMSENIQPDTTEQVPA